MTCFCFCRRQRPRLRSFTLSDGCRIITYTIDGVLSCLEDNNPEDPDDTTNNTSRVVQLSFQHCQRPIVIALHAMFLSGNSFLQHTMPSDYIMICVNRPGYHGTFPVTVGEYSYQDFAKDVGQLADHLQISKFSVIGHSSGGPNALACASFLPYRVVSIGILAGDPEYACLPEDESGDGGNERGEGDEIEQTNDVDDDDNHLKCPQHVAAATATEIDDPMTTSAVSDWFLGCCLPNFMRMMQPCWQVSNGLQNDFYLERQPYPFRTESIQQPALVVMGDQDAILPNKLAMQVHHRLPNSTLWILEGVGHNQLLEDDILDTIVRKVIGLGTPNGKEEETKNSNDHNDHDHVVADE